MNELIHNNYTDGEDCDMLRAAADILEPMSSFFIEWFTQLR